MRALQAIRPAVTGDVGRWQTTGDATHGRQLATGNSGSCAHQADCRRWGCPSPHSPTSCKRFGPAVRSCAQRTAHCAATGGKAVAAGSVQSRAMSRARAQNPRSPSPPPPPISPGVGVGVPPPISSCRGSGVHPHPHPRFAGGRGSTPDPRQIGGSVPCVSQGHGLD